jgi:hypothetical protein
MTLILDHLITIIIEFGIPENPKLDIKIMKLASQRAEIWIVHFSLGVNPLKAPQIL